MSERRPMVWSTALLVGLVSVSVAGMSWAAQDTANAEAAPTAPAAAGSAEVAVPEGELTLEELLSRMRSTKGVAVEFVETKEMALLSAPLETRGVIFFRPPDQMLRKTTMPGRSRLLVDGDQVRFADESGSQAMDLSASPTARQLIDSFVVLFNGDSERLHELYDIDFEADGARWHLHLLPRRAPLDRLVASIDLRGDGARMETMDMAEPDGDTTHTRFGRIDVAYRFEDGGPAELFEESGNP